MIRINLLTKRCVRCTHTKNMRHFKRTQIGTTSTRCNPCKEYEARKSKEYRASWSAEKHDRIRDQINSKNRALRVEVITNYGGKCACCGESRMEFLALDHPLNDGAIERRIHGLNGGSLYLNIKKAGFPDRYRVLCHNCNMARGSYGYCPHETVIDFIVPRPVASHRGDTRYNTDFTDAQILTMRKRRGAGERAADLAREYDVNQASMRKILNGKTWKHVEMPMECLVAVYKHARKATVRRMWCERHPEQVVQ